MKLVPSFVCRAGALACLALAFAVADPRAAETPVPQPPANSVPDRPRGAAPNAPAVQAQPPGCAVWTDRCIACMRMDGAISCSNIGIACQPQAVECLRREPAEEKK